MAATKSTTATDLVEVTLDKLHKHQGKEKKAGDKIKVTPLVRDWLIKNGVAKADTTEGAK